MVHHPGKWTGIVSTGRLSHATPAPLYSHSPDRMWEDDSLLPAEAEQKGCRDIASQLLNDVGQNLKVCIISDSCSNCKDIYEISFPITRFP